jgi:hypothetical protein
VCDRYLDGLRSLSSNIMVYSARLSLIQPWTEENPSSRHPRLRYNWSYESLLMFDRMWTTTSLYLRCALCFQTDDLWRVQYHDVVLMGIQRCYHVSPISKESEHKRANRELKSYPFDRVSCRPISGLAACSIRLGSSYSGGNSPTSGPGD